MARTRLVRIRQSAGWPGILVGMALLAAPSFSSCSAESSSPQTATAISEDEGVTASGLMPLSPRQGVYEIHTDSDEAPKHVSFRLFRDEGDWVQVKKDWARHRLRQTKEGQIVVPRESDLRQGLRIEYQPAVPLVPASLKNFNTKEGDVDVVIRDLATGKVKNRGTCHWRLQHRGQRTVETPAGTYDTYHIRATRVIEYGFTKVTMRIDFDYAPQVGQVVVRVHRKGAMFSLFGRTDEWTLKLSEVSDSDQQ